MRRVLIFGNSGAGKSSLAKALRRSDGLAHLDLDTLAWQPTTPPERKPLPESRAALMAFVASNEDWVIEGCYADLLELVTPHATEMIYLDLPVELCIANAKSRPWEPHKYESKEAQDANLDMLVEWIRDYTQRDDTFSARAHRNLFAEFDGTKRTYARNPA